MPRALSALLLIACGVVVGYSLRSPARPPAPPTELRGDITIRRPGQPVERLRPHAVRVDERAGYVNRDMPGERTVTVIVLDDGRVVIGCTANEE